MKFIGSLVLCLVLVVTVKAITEEQKMETMKLVMECQAQEKASDADIAEMMKHEIPTTSEGKCLHACMQTNIGIMVNGAFVPAGAIELTRRLTNGDDAKIKITAEMTEACRGVSDGDRCELGLKIVTCMEGEAAKRGIAIEY